MDPRLRTPWTTDTWLNSTASHQILLASVSLRSVVWNGKAIAAGPNNTAIVLRRPSESVAQKPSAASARPAGGASLAGASASAAGDRGFGGDVFAENAP